MQAQEIKEIRRRVDRSNARGVKLLVAEENAWRAVWPVVLVVAVTLNVIFAASYLAHVAPPNDAPPLLWGMNWSEWQNWLAAAALIIGTRVVSVFYEDAREGGARGVCVRLAALKVALVAFSIWTAALGVSLGIQQRMDAGAATSAHYQAAQDATAAHRDAVTTAKRDYDDAKAQARQARAEWSAYQAQHADGDPWLLNATHSQGPARPYVEAIQRGDLAVEATRAELAQARARLAAAINREGDAVASGGSSEETQLAEIGAWAAGIARALGVPVEGDFRAASVALAFGIAVAVLLEWLCVGGQTGAAAAKRSIMRDARAALDSASESVRASISTAYAPGGDHTHTEAYVQPRTHTYAPVRERMPMKTNENPEAGGENVVTLSTRVKHSDTVAEIVADAMAGRLASASFDHLRDAYGATNEAARLARDELTRQGLAVPGPAGKLVLVNSAV